MPYYELLCLASGKLDRKQLGNVLRKTCRAFMDNGATVTRLVPLGADGNGPRKLAYRIRINQVSYETGFYVTVCAFSSPTALDEVRRQLSIDERVLRHTVVRRRITDALLPIPDVNAKPPAQRLLDANDPEYALHKFIQEYQRDYPEGLSMGEVHNPPTSNEKASVGADDPLFNAQQNSVRDILAKLKETSPTARQEKDPGLAWLSKLKKPDPPEGGSST